jgi:DUF4097 and DUF4098 domain-containing protein YvlB
MKTLRNPIGLLTLAVVVGLLAAGPSLAQRSVDEKAAADKDGTVTIENIAGSIRIEGWDKAEVHVTGTLGKEVEELKFKAGGSKTYIKVVYPKKTKNIDEGADLVIMVPAGSSLEVECVSAPITVTGVTGDIYASDISGEVTVKGICRELDLETISGDLMVDGGAAEVSVQSISGEIKARGGKAEVEAQTVSGDLDLAFDAFTELSVESVSGDADVTGALAEDAHVSIDLHSGDLNLTVQGDVSADFSIETFSGDIKNAFGQDAKSTSKYTPGKELEFTAGGGDARVRINTFSGDVVIRKK